MSIAKIQKGDKVKIISGAYKGTLGQVIKVTKKIRPNKTVQIRAAVSTVPEITKYRKANRSFNLPGQMLSTTRLIDISNMMLADEKGQSFKTKIEVVDGKKVRVNQKTKTPVINQRVEKVEKLESDK
jgi:large subunit ribosomal protein L24